MAFQDTGAAGWTWTDPSGQALSEADSDSFTLGGGVTPDMVRPFGWLRHHAVISPDPLRGTLRFAFNPANPTPPVPTGAVGELVLQWKSATTTMKWTFKAKLFNLQTQVDSTRGGKLYYVYNWIESAESSTDTIVVA